MQLHIGEVRSATIRGVVVGNVALMLLAGAAGVAVILVLLWVRSMHHHVMQHFQAISAQLRFPGVLVTIVALLLQPLVTASIVLLLYGDGSIDGTVGALGLCAMGILVGLCGRGLDPRRASFRAVPCATNHSVVDHSPIRRTTWERFMLASNSWRGRHAVRDVHFVGRVGILFDACRGDRHWWLLVEVGATLIISGLDALAPDSVNSCRSIAYGALGVCLTVLVLALLMRPMNSASDTVLTNVMLAAQLAVVVCAMLDAEEAATAVGMAASAVSGLQALASISVVVHRTLRHRTPNLPISASAKINAPVAPRSSTADRVKAHHQQTQLKKLLRIVCDSTSQQSMVFSQRQPPPRRQRSLQENHLN